MNNSIDLYAQLYNPEERERGEVESKRETSLDAFSKDEIELQ